jgi:RNA polymerase primary sigma factor
MSAIACHGSPYAPNLQFYFRDIDGTEMLSRREECELAGLIAEGDPAARDRLIRANLRLVAHIAKGYRGRGLDMDDLIAEGNLGLMRAVEDFDGRMGVRFSNYASYWIKQSMRAALSNRAATIRLPVHAGVLLGKWRRAAAALERRLGREPSFDEVAGAMGLAEGQRRTIERALRTRRLHDAGEERLEAADPAGKGTGAVEEREEREELRRRVGRLDATARSIIALRYGLEGGEPMTLKEIGRRLGYTREWVRKIEARALEALR